MAGKNTKERHASLDVDAARLSRVVERLREVVGKQMHGDIQGAVKKWWMTEQLTTVNIIHSGWIDWWSCRDDSQTAGMRQWNVENAQLGHATFGVLQGRITLQSMGSTSWSLWSQKDELAPSSGDPNDFVNVRIGSSSMSLDLVGKFYNVRAPGQAGVRYAIEKEYTGQRFTYRFEFSSSSSEADDHMLVLRGRYQQLTPPGLEVVDESKNLVLSSYVKMRRIEEKQGKSRSAILLEELIKIERSPDTLTYWDTDVVNAHFQEIQQGPSCDLSS